MARVPGGEDITPVSPASDPGVRTDPNMFGAQLGTEMNRFGELLGAVGQKVREKENAAWVIETIAKTRRLINERSRAARESAEPGAIGFTERLTGEVDGLISSALEGAPNEDARLAVFERLSLLRESVVDSASDFEATERSVNLRSKVAESVDIMSAQLLDEPDQFDNIREEALSSLNILTPLERRDLTPAVEEQVASAYLSGRINQDPYAAKEELLSGRMAQYLGGKDAVWLDKAQAEIDRREAEERRRLEHERAVLRADVEADWRDNAVDARINGKVNPAYENRIRLAYADDPEQAEEKISYLHREVDRHKIETRIALAPNDAVETVIKESWPSGQYAAEEAQFYDDLTSIQTARDKAMREDPKKWILQHSPETKAVWDAAMQSNDPKKIDAAIRLTDDIAISMGYVPHILTEEEAKLEVVAFETISPEAAVDRLDQLRTVYGNHWPRVSAELELAGLPATAQVLDFTWSDPLWRAEFVKALQVEGGMEGLRKTLRGRGFGLEAKIEEAVLDNLNDVLSTIPDDTAKNTLFDAALAVAMSRAGTGLTPAEAAEFATGVITSQYEVVERSGRSFRIPVVTSVEDVRAGMDWVMQNLDQFPIQPDSSLNPAFDSPMGKQFLRQELNASLERAGSWITLADDSGVLLVDQQGQKQIFTNGRDVKFTWDELIRLGKGAPSWTPPPAGSTTMPEIPKPEPHQGFKPGDIIGRTSEGRAVVINDEGGISTERIITLEDPRQKGAWINIPSMYEGKVVSDPEALAIIVRAGFTDPETGRPIESFPSIEAAEEAAQLRTKLLDSDPGVRDALSRMPKKDDRDLIGGEGEEDLRGDISSDRLIEKVSGVMENLGHVVSLTEGDILKLMGAPDLNSYGYQPAGPADPIARRSPAFGGGLLGISAMPERSSSIELPDRYIRDEDTLGLRAYRRTTDPFNAAPMPPLERPAMPVEYLMKPRVMIGGIRSGDAETDPLYGIWLLEPEAWQKQLFADFPVPPERPGWKIEPQIKPAPPEIAVPILESLEVRRQPSTRIESLVRFASDDQLSALQTEDAFARAAADEKAWREDLKARLKDMSDDEFKAFYASAATDHGQVLDVGAGGQMVKTVYWADGTISSDPGRKSPFGQIVLAEAERRSVSLPEAPSVEAVATNTVRNSSDGRLTVALADPEISAESKFLIESEIAWRQTFDNYLQKLDQDQLLWLASLMSTVPEKQWVMPVSSGLMRSDTSGAGHYHASRGDHLHMGVDLIAVPGEPVYAPVDGWVTNVSGYVYDGDTRYRYVEVMTPDGYNVRLHYVKGSIAEGARVVAGETVLGLAQDISRKYGGDMKPHIHLEARKRGRPRSKAGVPIDPWPLLNSGGDSTMTRMVLREVSERQQLSELGAR